MVENNHEFSGILIISFSILSSVLLLLINIFKWTLIDIFTVFLFPIIELGVGVIFLVISILSIIYFGLKAHKLKYKAFIPLGINLVTFIIVLTIPFTGIMLYFDFKLNIDEREEIVSMVKSGELKANVYHNDSLIKLPEEYEHLSKGGGEIVVERDKGRLKVFFYTYRGVLDNFSGFAYISDNSELSSDHFNGDFKEIKKKKEHWYWGASK
ncbi:hypothetical protein GOQ27_10315 [Clostridium sp. D2Q-11]|uniref:Uncharacterized protein n=1 Tax=Anaeromonas frigoriresistens TaxID=2683708 RepID=A0A942UVL2_9FIRM|nr:hypothetical protein [Anaeromonas frigoriresistens]MBS4538860.1 hypothetical protein [Anaeromonas frigoriresistens]